MQNFFIQLNFTHNFHHIAYRNLSDFHFTTLHGGSDGDDPATTITTMAQILKNYTFFSSTNLSLLI